MKLFYKFNHLFDDLSSWLSILAATEPDQRCDFEVTAGFLPPVSPAEKFLTSGVPSCLLCLLVCGVSCIRSKAWEQWRATQELHKSNTCLLRWYCIVHDACSLAIDISRDGTRMQPSSQRLVEPLLGHCRYRKVLGGC